MNYHPDLKILELTFKNRKVKKNLRDCVRRRHCATPLTFLLGAMFILLLVSF